MARLPAASAVPDMAHAGLASREGPRRNGKAEMADAHRSRQPASAAPRHRSPATACRWNATIRCHIPAGFEYIGKWPQRGISASVTPRASIASR